MTSLVSQEVEPADDPLETEVVFVKTVVRKFRHVFEHPHDDLTCCHGAGCHRMYPNWEEGAYYESERELLHQPDIVVPRGSYFVLSCLTEGKRMTTYGEDDLKGDHMVMKTLDPKDPDSVLSFGFWHAAQAPQDRNFTKVDNFMVVLAIAATGLA